MTGRVLLVGAGPGDPELLTLRALRALREADVVLFDRLVPKGLSNLAPQAEWVDVGKRHDGGLSQAEINGRIMGEARAGRTVVRLKGGDPLIFARADEELAACRRARLQVEIVPGISAAQAAAAVAQRPLTSRDGSPWVLFLSAHQAGNKRGPRVPWHLAAGLGGTLAIYMCVAALGPTADRLIEAGRSPQTSVTLVARATLSGQRVLTTTLASVASEANAAGVAAPALLLVHQGFPLKNVSPPRSVRRSRSARFRQHSSVAHQRLVERRPALSSSRQTS